MLTTESRSDLSFDKSCLPIALISGDSSAADAISRAAGVLSKPFTFAELRSTVDSTDAVRR